MGKVKNMKAILPILEAVEGTGLTSEFEKIEYRTEPIVGMSIFFKNGIILSVISGEFAQGGENTPYEIGIIDGRTKAGDFMPEIFDVNDIGDDVLGFQTADDVVYYIEKIKAFRA